MTSEDQVFALGCNSTGCLGLGEPATSTLQARKVDVLCGKAIVAFEYGSGPHVLALTKTGEVFSWGSNGYCALGNGSTNHPGLIPAQVSGSLVGRVVTRVACGSNHSIALTETGDIYAWGNNNCGQIGSGTTTTQSTPLKVSSPFAGKRVVSISCGHTSSMVALETGEVYGWGYNGNGQLGLGNNINQLNPCRVSSLQGVVVVKVACGYAHTLALSDEGELYGWGANNYGQLGTGTKANVCSPAKSAEAVESRIVDVAASHYNHISVGVAQDGRVFMWGQCHRQSVPTPTETPFRGVNEVMAAFATVAATVGPLAAEDEAGPSVNEALAAAFDDKETADIKFVVEGKPIHVHKAIVKMRCEHFRSMFQTHWEEDAKDAIEIDQFSYEVYREFLRFLYTDEVKAEDKDGHDFAVGLLDLANSYCEGRLKQRCERLLRQGIRVENAAELYATAIKYEASELEEFCFVFALNHMTAVTQTNAFARLDEATVKEFIAKAAARGAFKS